MKVKTLFIGNESPYLETLIKFSELQLIVAEKVDQSVKRYFGSSYDFAIDNQIQIMEPDKYMKEPVPIDIVVVSGYPKLIPLKIINSPKIGIINIHHSYLPAYRGRHPINWAIVNGEKYSGVTIHHLNEKFDDGNIIFQKKMTIGKDDTVMDIYLKSVRVCNRLIHNMFKSIGTKEFNGVPQDTRNMSYYPPRKPKDGNINWFESSINVCNLVRALVAPYPGAYFYYKKTKIIIDKVKRLANTNALKKLNMATGRPFVFNKNVCIKTGDGYLQIVEIRNNTNSFIGVLNKE